MNKNIALIPAYKPKDNLIKLIKELLENNFEIIVVDDGSGKEYKDIFDKVKRDCQLISYKINKGKGGAIKEGLKYIKNNYSLDTIIVTMDCDGQHLVKDAKRLCNKVKENNLVIGKRIRNSNTPIRSKIGNSITRFIYHIITGVDIYDTQTGLRAFSYKMIDFLLNIEGKKYEYEMNVLLECAVKQKTIEEIEIDTIYINNNSDSHFKPLKDSIRIYKKIIKFSLSSFISFCIDYICYILFLIISKNIIISNILARVISSTINYNINKKAVFKNKEKGFKSIIQYCILAIFILFINTTVLNSLAKNLYINPLIAKILTEIIVFLFSFIIQNKVIFRNKKEAR